MDTHKHWQARDDGLGIAREYHLFVERDLFGWFVI